MQRLSTARSPSSKRKLGTLLHSMQRELLKSSFYSGLVGSAHLGESSRGSGGPKDVNSIHGLVIMGDDLSLQVPDLVHKLAEDIRQERERNLALTRELVQEKSRISGLENMILSLLLTEPELQEPTVCELVDGKYPPHIRKLKILKYKAKLQKRRQKFLLSREYKGRRNAALAKPRVNGKFVKYA